MQSSSVVDVDVDVDVDATVVVGLHESKSVYHRKLPPSHSEFIKNPDRHEDIIELCSNDFDVEAAVVMIINSLKSDDESFLVDNVATGLTNIADRVANGPALPAYNQLVNNRVTTLLGSLLENNKMLALLKDPSISSSAGTMFTAHLGDVDPSNEEIVTRLVLRAAFREAEIHGARLDHFKDACSKIFNKDSKYYDSAFKCVTLDVKKALIERSQELNDEDPHGPNWLDKVFDELFGGVLFLSNVQEQAENDLGSSSSHRTYYNKMETSAKTILIKWCESAGLGKNDTNALNEEIFQI
ncbi:hypothetical protein SEMRO_2557_G331170.1 [Seminavis robusta]|uniref:Uncharacterized protein n=1 Tax=Seminavis robusta TaxID=568900 RepID=A0A9N8I080_9STRA|nr:hypothetical protein SEMRO_2557_G331170.1 [Seminavis robusta]|eukprot:Sro2557_g331170.1 n/a (298) ;mRNA; r:5976-6869